MTGPRPPYTPVPELPGAYTDADGAIIVNAADVLAFLDIEDTPENLMSELLPEEMGLGAPKRDTAVLPELPPLSEGQGKTKNLPAATRRQGDQQSASQSMVGQQPLVASGKEPPPPSRKNGHTNSRAHHGGGVEPP